MTVNRNLIELFNGLIYDWKAYEETEYKSHHETGDKIFIDGSDEDRELKEYIRRTVLLIRTELEDIFLISDSHFNSVVTKHIYNPLWEIYKHPVTYKITFKQCEHLIKTLNSLLKTIYTFKSNLDLDDITKMLVNKSRGYRTFAETDLGTIIAKKYLLTPPTDFGNGGFGPVGKALPQGSLTYLFSGSKSSELSPHAEALIDNVKETLENIQYGILKPEESEEEKNYKGNKDKIKHKEHFYKFLNRQGMSIRK
jgi:hypothetical protein